MSLTDLPTVKPSEGWIFLFLIGLVIFIFFFTQPKASDVAQL
jgi:hypothetical protein